MNRSAPASRDIPQLRHVCEAVIYEHVFSNADREVGGVLVGKITAPGTKPVITGAIPAIAADERRATLTFTQDSWEHVHRVLDREYPEDQIVGWYHSHPSFGIFLSGHDLFIHRNFFSGKSQIALVVDPVAQEEGVFAWRPSTQDVDLYFKRPTSGGWYARTQSGKALPPHLPKQGNEKAYHEPDGGRLLDFGDYPLLAISAAAAAGFVAAFAIAFFVRGGFNGDAPQVTTTTPAASTPLAPNQSATTPVASTPVATNESTTTN